MFSLKNRSFVVKTVRDQDLNGVIGTSVEEDPNNNPYEGVEIAAAYAEVAKDFITHTALVVGGTFILCQIAKRLCK